MRYLGWSLKKFYYYTLQIVENLNSYFLGQFVAHQTTNSKASWPLRDQGCPIRHDNWLCCWSSCLIWREAQFEIDFTDQLVLWVTLKIQLDLPSLLVNMSNQDENSGQLFNILKKFNQFILKIFIKTAWDINQLSGISTSQVHVT